MSLRDDLVRIALSELGNNEANGGDMKYINWYGGFGPGTAWCAIYVSWCGNEAGMLNNWIPKHSWCYDGVVWYQNRGWWQNSKAYGGNYTPSTGDIIYFNGAYNQGASTHVGIVVRSDGTNVYTIEGNASDSVKENSYSVFDAYIIGYGVPPCGNATGTWGDMGGVNLKPGEGAANTTTLKPTIEYEDYKVKSGDTLQSVADKFGTSVSWLIDVNNIKDVTLKPGTTIKVPKETKDTTSSNVGKIAAKQSVIKKHTRGVTTSNPYAKVQLFTEMGLLSLTQTAIVSNTNLNREVLSINTNRDMGNDCPTFTINLCWRHEWYTKISPNDLVIITMVRPPESESPIMFGLVDDIRKSCEYNSKTPSRTLTITGRGFNKALINFVIGTISELNTSASTLGFMADQIDTFSGGTPAAIIQESLKMFVGKGCNYRFANGKRFTDYYQTSIKSNSKNYEFLADNSSMLSFQGNLWEYLKELKNSPFNEMFWEVVEDKPTLVFRPTPFNEDQWTKLYRTTVKDMDIIQENIGNSDLETYTIYKVTFETFATDTADLGYLPLWYPPYYSKYGINRLDLRSRYIAYNSETDENGKLYSILSRNMDIYNWNILNNSMKNGSMVVKGSNQYKIGSRLMVESDNMEFYIEGVSHSFTNFSGWTTTLQLTRGMEPQNRYKAPWGKAETMTPSDFTNMYISTNISTVGQNANTGNGFIPMSGNDVTAKTWNALRKAGHSIIATAGAMGNIHYESGGFNASAIEGGSGEGLGLCQWSFGRKTQLQNYAASLGKPATDENVQIQFLIAELDPNEANHPFANYQMSEPKYGMSANTWIFANDVTTATQAFCYVFERPNKWDADASMPQRIQAAKEYYEKFKGIGA